jgi:ATP-dependent Lon protease
MALGRISMTSSSSISLHELPLFPLPEVVLFPSGKLPLHIFEMRYRQMISTLLTGDRKFGVLMWDPATRANTAVGCVAEIGDVVYLPDGRMNITTSGLERFRVWDYVKQKPYLIGKVEPFDDFSPDRDLTGLKDDAIRLLNDVVRLSAKLSDKVIGLPFDMPEDPKQLSFWIASNLYGDPAEQQALLELDETSVRLEREIESLLVTCKELAARSAIKDALG